MNIKILLAIVALSLAPGLAVAQCSSEDHAGKLSCTDGKTFDPATKACVPITG